jgi:GT2 family glycosyltransferase
MSLENVWVVIPIGTREKYLPNLLNKLHKYRGRIVIVNNQPGYTEFEGVNHIEDFNGININRWWNNGIRYAEERGATHIYIVNDDVDMEDTFVENMYKLMIEQDLEVVDTSNTGNNGGSSWMLKLDSGLRPDEDFSWWYGDTLVYEEAEKRGKAAKYHEQTFIHFEPDGHTKVNQLFNDLIAQDVLTYKRKKGIN